MLLFGTWLLHLIVTVRHVTPVLVFLCGILIVFFLPLPSFLRWVKPFPEEEIFRQYRANFEHVVELARQDDLVHDDRYINNAWYVLPTEFQHLSLENSLIVYNRPSLVVVFEPTDYYYPIVYVDDPEAINQTSECYYDGNVERQLDVHWYLCTREWN